MRLYIMSQKNTAPTYFLFCYTFQFDIWPEINVGLNFPECLTNFTNPENQATQDPDTMMGSQDT